MLSDLLVGVAVSHVSSVTRRCGVVDGRSHDKTGLEALHLGGFED